MSQIEIIQMETMEKLGRLLNSQRAFLSFPQPFQVDPLKPQTIFIKCFTGGWRSGKTRTCIINALMLSALFPGNEGLVGRFKGKDLEMSVIPLFFEVCPPSWIKKVTGRGKTGMTIRLVNGSTIYFSHIDDPTASAAKTRRVGSNLGWALLDQIEEMKMEHVTSIMGRLSNVKAKIKMLLCSSNPNGRDWHQKMFFPDWKPLDSENGELFRLYQKGNIVGVHVNSEENRVSNGGFIEDNYFDNLVTNLPPDQLQRYVYASFEDFTGKVYKGYSLDSPHNIDPFPIPSHWECVVPIDVGGSCPWSVTPMYCDEQGNLIVTDGFHQATGRTAEVAEWIKIHTPWNENRTTFVIDPENKVAAVELSDLGIYSRVAQKAVHPGILRTAGYFHLRQHTLPPKWFLDTQSTEAIERIKKFGVPKIYFFKTDLITRMEHDEVVWDDKIANQIKKTAKSRFDTVDGVRYGTMTRPEASALPTTDKYSELEKIDTLSANEAREFDRRIQSYIQQQKGGSLKEAFFDGFSAPTRQSFSSQKYDWADN